MPREIGKVRLKKTIWGQKTKNGRKPGLTDVIGEIPALAAFYMLNKGLKGVNRVMNITGWTWDYINEILATTTRGINHFLHKIGKTAMKLLEKCSHGIAFTMSLMGALGTGEKTKKITKVRNSGKIVVAAENNNGDDHQFDEEETEGDPDQHEDDPQDEDPKATHEPESGGFDDPEALSSEDRDDPDEPPKTPRAVAFHLLEATRMRLERMRDRTPGDQRLLDLLRLVDPPTRMVDALQKGATGPSDPKISQHMADCLNLAWQWAHRIGIFTTISKHQKYLDMPTEQFLAALIAGVRDEYLTPDETPPPPKTKPRRGEKAESDSNDPGRKWVQVMDWETGRVARVTRKTPPGNAQLPATTARILDVDDAVVAEFLDHCKLGLKPKARTTFKPERVRLRFWSAISSDGEVQIITGEREKRLSKKSIEVQVEDVDDIAPADDPGMNDELDLNAINIQEDLIAFGDYQALAKLLKLTTSRVMGGLTGDSVAMSEMHEAIRALNPDARDAMQDMVIGMLRLGQAAPQAIDESRLAG